MTHLHEFSFRKMIMPELFSQQPSLVYRLSFQGAGIVFATEPRWPVVEPNFAFAEVMKAKPL